MSHPVVNDIRVRDTVRFVKRHALENLEVPWPRSQDLPCSSFSKPDKDDFVVAVSHVWPYQAHPDPLGEKCPVLRELLAEACAIHRPRGKTLLFVDFLSTPQRPFARGQASRTPAQEEAFAATLMAFPMVYFMADATIHIDVEMSAVPEDTCRYTVTPVALRGVQLQTVGPTVQVVDFGATCSRVAPFDFVTSIGDCSVQSTEDVDRFRDEKKARPAPTLSLSWSCCHSCPEQELETVQMRRAPYGRRNLLPANVKGWIFLERFVSMVKVAMVPESRVTSVAFSNSQSVLEEIFAGGARLRSAAAGGKAKLHETLEEFAKELDTKKFSTVSMDDPCRIRRGRSKELAATSGSAHGASARDVVWELMQVLVAHLALHWEAEAAAQRQRQLVLAVCRGDVADAVSLIEARANPNGVDTTGRTCLHTAASFRQLEMVCELLRYGADTTVEDDLGNLPIHLLPLYSQDPTVELFNMLAPSEVELAKANVAGVSPLKKFATWVEIECREAPFAPAQRRLEELRALFPEVLRRQTPGAITRASLSLMLAPVVRGCERRVVGGRLVSIPVWEPPQLQLARVHIVFLALCQAMPWSIAEAAAGLLAECVCSRFGAKLWAISSEALDPAVLAAGAPLPRVVDDLAAVVSALPLGDRFFVVDDSCGLAVPLLWRLPDRLHGALIVNAAAFFSEEFEGTQLHRILGQVFTRQLCLARSRNPERAASVLMQWSTAPCYEELAQRRDVFEAALRAAPESHWLWCAYSNLDVARLSRLLWTLPPLPALPVTFAVGSLAPAPFNTEPLVRFQLLLPNSTVAYIPDSRLLWNFEGEGPSCKVALLLYELMENQLQTRSL